MRLSTRSMCVAVIMAAIAGQQFPQESAQAQAPEEAKVAADFTAAAPALFRKWLESRSDQLKKLSLGRAVTQMNCANFVVFIECQDSTKPSDYRIDAKMASVPTESVGLMFVPLKMTCSVKAAYARVINQDKMINLFVACQGATYDECLAVGMKPVNRMMKAMCKVKELGTSFSYEGEEQITYRWSDGSWQLQEQREVPPLPVRVENR